MRNNADQLYKYQCIDHSIVTPFFKKYIVAPTLFFIPKNIPANYITLLSFFCVLGAFSILLMKQVEQPWIYSLIPVLLFLYLYGDHLDGMQAKRTKTSSGLGEFCDHFLDIFATGMITYILFSFFHIRNEILFFLSLFSNYMLHATIIHEQYKTGWLIFDKIGSLEGVLFAIALILLGLHPTLFSFFTTTVFMNMSLIEGVILFVGIGTVLTTLKTNTRTHPSRSFLVHYILSFFVLLIAMSNLNFFYCFVTFMLYQVYYIGSLIRARVLIKKEPTTDLITPIFTVSIAFFNLQDFVHVLLGYLFFRIMIIVYTVFKNLKEHWYWKNPQHQTTPIC